MYSNELYHYGVKGMKWGVRRYQNSDGTRTARGKIHDKLTNMDRKRAAEHAVKTAASAATLAGVVYAKRHPEAVKNAIKMGATSAAKTLADATKSGARDAVKVVVTGGLIYAGEKLIDNRKGHEAANKIIQYGRQPQKKK